MRSLLPQEDSHDVHTELVDAMADSDVPVLILAGLIALVGGYVLAMGDASLVQEATAVGVLCCALKVAVILKHRRDLRNPRRRSAADTRRLEIVHAVSTLAVAGSVGFLTVAIFAMPDVELHLAATSLLFGYCAGVINRLSVRPRIALCALVCAGIPGIFAAAHAGTNAHFVLAAVFACFLGGAIQSVGYAYETARRGVALRLQMATLARRDPLTGLHNRLGLGEALDALPCDGRSMLAVHAFDLDGFKLVNDLLGHAAGDRLLAILSERVRTIVPTETIVARTGGDEFVLVQLGVSGETEVRRLAQSLLDHLVRPYDLGAERPVSIGLSLGYAMGVPAQTCASDLMHRADEASYIAKRAGGGIRAYGEVEPLLALDPLEAPRKAASA